MGIRVASKPQVTADRVQADLLQKKREWFKDWAPVPSVDSVGDFFHLKDNPVQAHPISQVLSESARRGLQRWQVAGPEQGLGTAANAMRSLRKIHDAVARVP